MNPIAIMLIGLGLGTSLMYLMDPEAGNRRRAILGDKLRRGLRKAGDAADVTARDLGNRAQGLAAEAQSWLTRHDVDDRVLAERVRAELGRVCSHPRSIAVSVWNGRVTLAGPILAHEADRVTASVASVPGVTAVDNRLDIHEDAGRIPDLQGGVSRRVRSAFMQTSWSPTARLMASLAGVGLALYGVGRRGLLGLVAGLGGLGLFARSATNLEIPRLLGLATGRPAVTVRKSLNVQAPIERVYELWSDIESFPRFMANVREVRDLGAGRSRWTVAGPGGVSVEWEAVVTKRVANQELAWQTVPGSTVEHAGHIRFLPNPSGGTRLDVHLSYTPPTGALGHGIAWLFGADPKTEMDADLARMKTLVEAQEGVHAAPEDVQRLG